MAIEIAQIGLHIPDGIAPRGDDAPALVRKLMMLKPGWKLGKRGPDIFDCWSMNQLVQYHLFGRLVTVVDLGDLASAADVVAAIAAHPANAQWIEHDGPPRHGDAIKMGHIQDPHHTGTFLDIDRGGVLHHDEHEGVCFDTLSALRTKGFRKLRPHSFAGVVA